MLIENKPIDELKECSANFDPVLNQDMRHWFSIYESKAINRNKNAEYPVPGFVKDKRTQGNFIIGDTDYDQNGSGIDLDEFEQALI